MTRPSKGAGWGCSAIPLDERFADRVRVHLGAGQLGLPGNADIDGRTDVAVVILQHILSPSKMRTDALYT